MSKNTCKDCLHCSIEDADEVYCSGMPWHYPFGGSDTTTLDREACEHFLERDKPTLFHRITASPEALAEKLVYCEEPERFCEAASWCSLLLGKVSYAKKAEAIAATVAKLNEAINYE